MNRKQTRFSLRQTLRKTFQFMSKPVIRETLITDLGNIQLAPSNSTDVEFSSKNETEVLDTKETTFKLDKPGTGLTSAIWRIRNRVIGPVPKVKGIMKRLRGRRGPLRPQPFPNFDPSHAESIRIKLECLKPTTDFNSIPGGRKCCLKSAKCFQNLPDDLEEFDNRQPADEFDAATACKEIDDALLCMSNVFINFDCHQTADIVNRNLNKELQTVRKIYSGHCKGQQKPTTTTEVVPGNHNSQNQSSVSANQDLPASALIGVAVGGLLFVAIFILIIVLLKRRKNPRDTESNKVVFENNSDDSTRYKSFTRRNSDVYAEIDDRALQRSIRLNNNKDLSQSGEDEFESRPLPNAPTTQLSADDNGYLTPESSRRLKREMGGYDQLSRDIRDKHCLSQTYDKLESDNDTVEKKSGKAESDQSRNDTDGDGEYITPPGGENPPKSQTEENYHMYFVLEKQTG